MLQSRTSSVPAARSQGGCPDCRTIRWLAAGLQEEAHAWTAGTEPVAARASVAPSASPWPIAARQGGKVRRRGARPSVPAPAAFRGPAAPAPADKRLLPAVDRQVDALWPGLPQQPGKAGNLQWTKIGRRASWGKSVPTDLPKAQMYSASQVNFAPRRRFEQSSCAGSSSSEAAVKLGCLPTLCRHETAARNSVQEVGAGPS